MDETDEPQSIDTTLREVARTRRVAAALLHGADAAEIDDVLQEASGDGPPLTIVVRGN